MNQGDLIGALVDVAVVAAVTVLVAMKVADLEVWTGTIGLILGARARGARSNDGKGGGLASSGTATAALAFAGLFLPKLLQRGSES